MRIASVLAVVDGGTASSTVIRTALQTGRAFDALTALMQISPPPIHQLYPAGAIHVAGPFDQMVADLQQELTVRRSHFDTLFDRYVTAADLRQVADTKMPYRAGFAVCKTVVDGHENQEIACRGRLYDLIVVAPPDAESGGVDSAALEAALLDTGRPVLITPREAAVPVRPNVTIAWDGSREAALSLRNALPFIAQASNVDVVYVELDGTSSIDPDDVARYLTLHGVAARPKRLRRQGRRVSEALIEAAQANHNALLVMGAYGQSEAGAAEIFGSVSRAVMNEAVTPLLLSH